jgi:hypothetical protein
MSEGGTPRAAGRDTPVATSADSHAFALSLKGAPLVRIKLHVPQHAALRPGGTFSGTLDFRPPADAATLPALCHQVRTL